MKKEKISGVYGLRSMRFPDKIYVGGTKDIRKRWKEHFSRLFNNNHENAKLQYHFNKYGPHDLVLDIILKCEIDKLAEIEQAIIDYFDPWFNICKQVNSRLGIKVSNKSKLLMSSARQGPYTCNRRVIIDMVTGICFDSITEAARAYNINYSTLFNYLTGKSPSKTNLLRL